MELQSIWLYQTMEGFAYQIEKNNGNGILIVSYTDPCENIDSIEKAQMCCYDYGYFYTYDKSRNKKYDFELGWCSLR